MIRRRQLHSLVVCGLGVLCFLACGGEQQPKVELSTPWQGQLDLLNVDPGIVPSDREAGDLDAVPAEKPQPVRLLVGVRNGCVRVLEGPYPVLAGSDKFSRHLASRRTGPPVAWWFQWSADADDSFLRTPEHWTPFDAGAGVHGSWEIGEPEAHAPQEMQTETQIGVNLPFYSKGTVAAVSAEGRIMGMWRFGDTPTAAMTVLAVPGNGS